MPAKDLYHNTANANGEDVRPIRGRKSKMRQSSVKLEAHTVPSGQCG